MCEWSIGVLSPEPTVVSAPSAASGAARSYERHIVPFARPFAQSTVRLALESLAGAERDPVVLDHGAGTGLVSNLVLDACPSAWIVALDPNAELLDVLRPRAHCECLVGTAADLAAGERFDLVVSNLVLPFCPDAAGDLGALREAARPGAALVITTLGTAESVTPFHRFWSSVQAVVPGAWSPKRYPHHRFGTRSDFVGAVEAGGWAIEVVRPVRAVRRISATGAWAWLSAVLPVGTGDSYRSLSDGERADVERDFLGQWSRENRWVSEGWTIVARNQLR